MAKQTYVVRRVQKGTDKKSGKLFESGRKCDAEHYAETKNKTLSGEDRTRFEFRVFPGEPAYRIIQGIPV